MVGFHVFFTDGVNPHSIHFFGGFLDEKSAAHAAIYARLKGAAHATFVGKSTTALPQGDEALYMARGAISFMPAVFAGHGNPMNILAHNRWTEGWSALGAAIPRPKAVLAVSAHWYVPGTMVTAMERPRTIHDFGGFPRELYEVEYPAPGDPLLARKVQEMLDPIPVGLDSQWGLDHGTWSVLCHMFPSARVPVVQLSVDLRQPPSFHYEIGKLLAPLRDEGVLLFASGNVVHNIQLYDWDRPDAEVFGWASRFDEMVGDFAREGKDERLVDYSGMGPDARLAVPTPDHYLPLLYVLGSRKAGEEATFPVEGFDGRSMSMRCVQIS
jgi:4,5-DOPA dioxygenase extradiol